MKKIYTGIVLGLFPIFTFVFWLITFSNNEGKRYKEIAEIYLTKLYNVPGLYLSALNIITSISALYLLLCCINSKPTIVKAITAIYSIIIMIMLFFNIWTLL